MADEDKLEPSSAVADRKLVLERNDGRLDSELPVMVLDLEQSPSHLVHPYTGVEFTLHFVFDQVHAE